jgi:hypothetical protein
MPPCSQIFEAHAFDDGYKGEYVLFSVQIAGSRLRLQNGILNKRRLIKLIVTLS